MSSSFGSLFKVATFGESHGEGLGAVIDGCPPRIPIDLGLIQKQLDRRKPGQHKLTSPRVEGDKIRCLSGVEDGLSLGSPIALIIFNENAKPDDYRNVSNIHRPSHADFTTTSKYGVRAKSGGGRASARETVARVAAAALAEQVLQHYLPDLKILAWVDQVHDIKAGAMDLSRLDRVAIDQHMSRCPCPEAAAAIEHLVSKTQSQGDTLGGIIRGAIIGAPPGLGEPVFDKFHGDLAKGMLSIPASKGFEIGSGFGAARMKGSEHNDAFFNDGTRIRTRTNRSGGVQGGITNGEIVDFRVAFKPVSSIQSPQQTVTTSGEQVTLEKTGGRHDPLVLPRAVTIVEAMTALVLCDHYLRQRVYAPR
jgi:chorismate synthase